MNTETTQARVSGTLDPIVINRAAYNDKRKKAVCCMCGALKRPFCWDESYLHIGVKPFCSWTCRKLYLYGDVDNP